MTGSIRAGTSLARLRPSSASSLTQELVIECSDHSTTMQPIWLSEVSITCRQVMPAGTCGTPPGKGDQTMRSPRSAVSLAP
jgi:hypothetical protein